MKVLVCAATLPELEAFGLGDARALEAGRLWEARDGFLLAVTGTGIPLTLARLMPLLARLRPALLVNTGIAGAYPEIAHGAESGAALEIGDVVVGESETFADLGMEIPGEEGFRPLAAFPFADEALRAPLPLFIPDWAATLPQLKRGRGATVNACAGTEATGGLRRRLFAADFESMEGAACALAGSEAGVPVLEIRAVSNRAAYRDMRAENVARALDGLRTFWVAHRARLAQGEGR